MAKWLRKHKFKRQIKPLNPINIPHELAGEIRDEILEKDPSYISNVRDLNRRISSGKIPKWQWKNCRDAIAIRALIRAGLGFRESEKLLAV